MLKVLIQDYYELLEPSFLEGDRKLQFARDLKTPATSLLAKKSTKFPHFLEILFEFISSLGLNFIRDNWQVNPINNNTLKVCFKVSMFVLCRYI